MSTATTSGHQPAPPAWMADLPSSAREAISAIAKLLGHASDDGESPAAWAARMLGTRKDQLVTAHGRPTRTHMRVAGIVLSRAIDTHQERVLVSGPGRGEPPMWMPFSIGGGEAMSVPARMVVYFPAHTFGPVEACVSIYDDTFDQHVRVYTTREHRDAAATLLRQLLDGAAGDDNPLRGRVLHARASTESVTLVPTSTPDDRRDGLVLPDQVWREVDLCVAALTEHRDTLDHLGLGTARGLLVAGRPGVGKTNLARVLAAELAGRFTVIFADASTLASRVIELYDELDHLGRAMIVFEDIDLIVGNREHQARAEALADFLSAVDGAKCRRDVLTVATTNNPAAIDPAAQRSARFDTVVTLPMPDAGGRAKILQRYLDPIGLDLDVERVANVLSEVTGADLREVVRRTVLEHGDSFTAQELRDVAISGRWKAHGGTGQYL